jgi:hypothetical protein
MMITKDADIKSVSASKAPLKGPEGVDRISMKASFLHSAGERGKAYLTFCKAAAT